MRDRSPHEAEAQNTLLARLALDPGTRTIGQLIQDREVARLELVRLQRQIDAMRAAVHAKGFQSGPPPDKVRSIADATAFAPGSLLRMKDVRQMMSLSSSTLYRMIGDGEFPKPVRIGERSVRWRIEDLEHWRDSRR